MRTPPPPHRRSLQRVRAVLAAFVVASLLSLAAPASAQSIRITMEAEPTVVRVGQRFMLEVRVDANGGEPEGLQLPDLSAFDVLQRQVSQPHRFQFSFGGQAQIVSATTVHSFVLNARSAGRVRLAPARVRFQGRTYDSEPLTIQVIDGQGQVPSTPSATLDPLDPKPPVDDGSANADPSLPPEGRLDGAQIDGRAFLRTVVRSAQPGRIRVGEQVTVTIYIYARGGLSSQPVVSREASTDGFWVQDLLANSGPRQPTQQSVNGMPFQVYVFRRFAAFPLRPGRLTIGAMTVQVETGNNLFDLFGGGGGPIVREGVAIPIEVEDLPAQGRPQGQVFVGSLEASAALDRAQCATGDAVSFSVTVRGSGNLRDLRPSLPPIDGLQILEPEVRDDLASPNDVVGGSRTFTWLIVPQRPGSYTLPALTFQTFDPVASHYAVVSTTPRELTAAGRAVAADATDSEPSNETAPSAEERPRADRFGPVREQSALLRSHTHIAGAPWYPFALLLAPLAYLVLVASGRARRLVAQAEVKGRPKRAMRDARKRLERARALAGQGDARAFYGEIAQALKTMVEVRLGEPIGGLTHDRLRGHLVRRGFPDDAAARLVDELDGADFARFSALGAKPDEMNTCLERAQALMERLERFTPTRDEEPPR